MSLLRLDALRHADAATDPFRFTVVPDFIGTEDAQAIRHDFPDIAAPGLFPLEATRFGPRFGALVEALRSQELAEVFSEIFGIDVVGRPTMITVRGRCQEKDGRIHTDSEAKLVTALLYFNDGWESQGGRLRLLRGPDDLNDMIAEVPPLLGTLVAFRRSNQSFHGHEPFVGVRRYVMLNYMANTFVARKELLRHAVSARVKRGFALAGETADA
ncbi:MAG TPA: 2OG-Fe(II) oxygenase [Rhodopila sp.]|nr:2OG-Fe(II) oxygenase [Rhodopila sp.]